MKLFCVLLLFLSIDAILCSCPDNTVPWSNGSCKPVEDAVFEATVFLKLYMPKFDKPFEATLFEGGIVIPTINISLIARQKYPFAAKVQCKLFRL